MAGLGICCLFIAILSSFYFDTQLDELALEKVRNYNDLFMVSGSDELA